MALARGCGALWRASRPPLFFPTAARVRNSGTGSTVPLTSLSRPPWPELEAEPPEEQRGRHAALVAAVNRRIQRQDFGRLFAVVHFAAHQWKVTAEDLILIDNQFDAECGDRIRLEKVLLVGAEDFTLVGRPLLAKDLVRVEATLIEKTQAWPKIHQRFWRRHRFERREIIVRKQTVLRINSIELAPILT